MHFLAIELLLVVPVKLNVSVVNDSWWERESQWYNAMGLCHACTMIKRGEESGKALKVEAYQHRLLWQWGSANGFQSTACTLRPQAHRLWSPGRWISLRWLSKTWPLGSNPWCLRHTQSPSWSPSSFFCCRRTSGSWPSLWGTSPAGTSLKSCSIPSHWHLKSLWFITMQLNRFNLPVLLASKAKGGAQGLFFQIHRKHQQPRVFQSFNVQANKYSTSYALLFSDAEFEKIAKRA